MNFDKKRYNILLKVNILPSQQTHAIQNEP